MTLRYLILSLCSFILTLVLPASAAVEVGLGQTHFNTHGDGVWYQQPFDHQLNLTSNSASIGVTDYALPRVRYRLGYMYVGHASSSALAVSSDPIYTLYGANSAAHWPLSHWYGEGKVQSLYASLVPEYQVEGLKLGAEFGLHVYRPTWMMTIPDWRPSTDSPANLHYDTPRYLQVENNGAIRAGLMYGLSAGYGSMSISITRMQTKTSGGFPAIWDGFATNYSLIYRGGN